MGYWPGLRSRWLDIGQVIIFLRVYRPMRSRGPWTHKKRTKSISSHLKRTHLVNKDFLYGFPKFFLRDRAGCPEKWGYYWAGHGTGESISLEIFCVPTWSAATPLKKKPRIKYFSTRRLLTYATFSELDVVAITHETVFVNDQSYALMNCWHVRDKMGFSGPADVIPYSLTHVIPPHGLPTSNTVGVLGSKERVGGPPRGYLI